MRLRKNIKKHLRELVPFFLLLTISFGIHGQTKTTSHSDQIWLGYFNQIRFHKHWETWTDFHLRSKDRFTRDLSQGVARLGLTYIFKDEVKLTGGYAFFNHFPADNHKNISQPEHRIWQQVQWRDQLDKAALNHRFRFEQRFRKKVLNDSVLGDDYHFNWRFRYQLQAQIPIVVKWLPSNALALVLSDEIMLNAGKQININFFDQNRLFSGLNYKIDKSFQLQLGYMYIFQQNNTANNFRTSHVLRVFVFHTLNMRRRNS